MKTPEDKTVTLSFVSHPMKDPKMRWTVRLTFPAGAGPETELPIEAEDGEGVPIAAAEFEFAGGRIPVRDGRAALRYADFIKGRHATALWMHRAGMAPIPGGLTFQ